jgi:hypothetical protein
MFPRGNIEVLELIRKLQEGEFFVEERYIERLGVTEGSLGNNPDDVDSYREWERLNKTITRRSRLNLLFQYENPNNPANPGPINLLQYLETMIATHAQLCDENGFYLDEVNEINKNRFEHHTHLIDKNASATPKDVEELLDSLNPLSYEFGRDVIPWTQGQISASKKLKPHGATSKPTPHRLTAYNEEGRLSSRPDTEGYDALTNGNIVVTRSMMQTGAVQKVDDTNEWLSKFIGIRSLKDDSTHDKKLTFSTNNKDILRRFDDLTKDLRKLRFEEPEPRFLEDAFHESHRGSLLDLLNAMTKMITHIRNALNITDNNLQSNIDKLKTYVDKQDDELDDKIKDTNTAIKNHETKTDLDHPNSSVKTNHIANSSITWEKIAKGAVTTGAIKSPILNEKEKLRFLGTSRNDLNNEVYVNWRTIEYSDLPTIPIYLIESTSYNSRLTSVPENASTNPDWGVLVSVKNTTHWLEGRVFFNWIADAKEDAKASVNYIINSFKTDTVQQIEKALKALDNKLLGVNNELEGMQDTLDKSIEAWEEKIKNR